jgi:hypothetical protein
MTNRPVGDRSRREPRGLGRLAWGLCLAAEAIAAVCVVLLLAGHVSLGWRWLVGLTVVSGVAFDAQTLLDPGALAVTDRPVAPLIDPAAFHAADPLWAVATLLLVGVLGASVAELIVGSAAPEGWSGCS